MPSQLLEYSTLAALAYAALLYGVMLLAASAALTIEPVERELSQPTHRWGTMDGLRGILATGVFVHHSYTAWVFHTTGRWEWSASPVLNQLGQSTVAIFFMITGFLFSRKALAARMDWTELYRSRVARLCPLYFVAVAAVFALVFSESGGKLAEPLPAVAVELARWLAFVVFGRPDINGFQDSWHVMAGVNWSLKYEALFYVFGVPALYLVARFLTRRWLFAAALVSLVALLALRAHAGSAQTPTLYLAHFLGGILVAYGMDHDWFADTVRRPWFRALAAAAFVYLCTQVNAFGAGSVLAGAAIFAASVGGLSIFGLLRTRPALWLGDVSYGIYLIHGMVLWVVLRFLVQAGSLGDVELPEYALLASLIGCCVVALASLSYVAMERPAMRWSQARREHKSKTFAPA